MSSCTLYHIVNIIAQSWEYRMEFDISVFRYTGGTIRYQNTEYNIGTDTEWYRYRHHSVSVFGIVEFPAPTKIPHDICMCPDMGTTQDIFYSNQLSLRKF